MAGKYTALYSLMRNERRPVAALHRMQEAKLRRLIRHAYAHVPFYRTVFESRGLTPDDIRKVEDLHKLPVIDKADFRDQPTARLIDDRLVSTADLIRISTSGSSGAPFDLFIDRQYDQLRKAQCLRTYLGNGRRLSDRSVYFTGHPGHKPKWFKRLGLLREWRIDCGAPHANQLHTLNAVRPQIVQGYPSALSSFAAFIRDERIPIRSPRLVFTDSELLTPQSRELVEQTFRAPVIDVFGSWETGDIAYQCGRRSGYHMAIDCAVFELIAKDGKPVRDFDEGELVCTMLDNLAMPLIRYNLHDIAAYAASPCTCGRSFPTLQVIAGRSNDKVRLPDGRTLSAQGFLTSFESMGEMVREFQVVQQALERFRINVVPGAGFDAAVRERLRLIVTAQFPAAEVTVAIVDRIEREPSGKLRAFRSQVSTPAND